MANMPHTTAQRPRHLINSLVRCMKAKLVPIVRSSPGIGKSDIARQIAREFNLKFLDVRLAQCDPTDMNGLPYFTAEGHAAYAPFESFPIAGASFGNAPDGTPYAGWLINFDEITSAGKQLQAAAYKILLDRQIGNQPLHDRVAMMAAGNLETDNAVVHSMSTALQSRLIHLELAVNKNDWMDWAVKNDIDSRVMAFIEFKPTLLHKFQPDSQEHTYPCPRTWHFASKLVKDRKALTTEDDLPLLAGTVGPGAAAEFLEFACIYELLPTIDQIIANPGDVMLPNEPGIKFALATMVAENMDKTNATNLVKFLERLPVECQVLCLRMSCGRNPTLLGDSAVAGMLAKLGRTMTA